MEDWQKRYNAFFNQLAVQSLSNKRYCKNCGCEFYDHRYWYSNDKNHTECHGCKDCKWFEPMGITMERLLALPSNGDITA